MEQEASLRRDLNEDKQPSTRSRGRATGQSELPVPGPGDGNRPAYSTGGVKRKVNVNVAGTRGDVGGDSGAGHVAGGTECRSIQARHGVWISLPGLCVDLEEFVHRSDGI